MSDTHTDTHLFQHRHILNFRVAYFHNFQICIFPIFPDCRISLLLEIWKSDNNGNAENFSNMVFNTSHIDSYLLLSFM